MVCRPRMVLRALDRTYGDDLSFDGLPQWERNMPSDTCQCGKMTPGKWRCAHCQQLWCNSCLNSLEGIPNQHLILSHIPGFAQAFPDRECTCGARITKHQIVEHARDA